MRDVAMYMSACFMLAGLVGIALLVLEFAVRSVQEYYDAKRLDAIAALPVRPPSRQKHYGWGMETSENPYAEYAVKASPKG